MPNHHTENISTDFGVHTPRKETTNNISAQKLNEIPGRQVSDDMTTHIPIRSAVYSNYAGMIAMMGADNCVYLGKADHYIDGLGTQPGIYDNTDDSLYFISRNRDMYYWLYGEGWIRSQADMLRHGLTMRQYTEFARLQEGVLSQFEQQRQITFAGQPFRAPNYLQNAELTEEGMKQNYNQIDGLINNQPAPRADLTDGQTHDEIRELAPETLKKPSVLEQLKAHAEGQSISLPANQTERNRGF